MRSTRQAWCYKPYQNAPSWVLLSSAIHTTFGSQKQICRTNICAFCQKSQMIRLCRVSASLDRLKGSCRSHHVLSFGGGQEGCFWTFMSARERKRVKYKALLVYAASTSASRSSSSQHPENEIRSSMCAALLSLPKVDPWEVMLMLCVLIR
jgi:hypothetical protein